MMGYGPEDNHFVVELTYNYGIKNYEKGNEFQVCQINLLVVQLQYEWGLLCHATFMLTCICYL